MKLSMRDESGGGLPTGGLDGLREREEGRKTISFSFLLGQGRNAEKRRLCWEKEKRKGLLIESCQIAESMLSK